MASLQQQNQLLFIAAVSLAYDVLTRNRDLGFVGQRILKIHVYAIYEGIFILFFIQNVAFCHFNLAAKFDFFQFFT